MPSYPELLKECYSVDIVLSDEDIKLIERETIDQAKGGAFSFIVQDALEHQEVKLQVIQIQLNLYNH